MKTDHDPTGLVIWTYIIIHDKEGVYRRLVSGYILYLPIKALGV